MESNVLELLLNLMVIVGIALILVGLSTLLKGDKEWKKSVAILCLGVMIAYFFLNLKI